MGLCKIILDNIGTFSPGDTITGTVICVFGAAENIREIECNLQGDEKTKFSKKRGKRNRYFKGHHELFKMKLTLQGEGTMMPGNFEYRFSFTLPSIVPGSFSDTYGTIRYFITAKVDRPFAFDYSDEVTVNVNSPINLNLIRRQSWLEPVAYQIEKVLCFWCCASSPIEMTLILEKTAFVIGEIINIRVEINNLSNTSIQELQIKLTRHIEYRYHKSSSVLKYVKYPITQTKATGVGAHGQRMYLLDFKLPETIVVNNFALCTLIKDWWMLRVEAVLPGCHKNLSLRSKLFLGHQQIDIAPNAPLSDNAFTPTAPLSDNSITPTAPASLDTQYDEPPSYYDAAKQEVTTLLEPTAPTR